MSDNLEFNILVNAKYIDGRFHINLKQLPISDSDTYPLTHGQMTRVLTSGICLLIKIANEASKKKDYELLKEVISHLESEFISVDSFSDAKSNFKKV